MAQSNPRKPNKPTEFRESLSAPTSFGPTMAVEPLAVNWNAALMTTMAMLAIVAAVVIGRNLLNAPETFNVAPGQAATLQGNPALQSTTPGTLMQGTSPALQAESVATGLQPTPQTENLQGTFNSPPAIR